MAEPPAAATPEVPPSAQDVLLATKLHVPRPQPGVVPRPRLAEQLDEGLGRGLVLVCAPAGYGKTVLLADWAQRGPQRAAWLSLDAGDNDPGSAQPGPAGRGGPDLPEDAGHHRAPGRRAQPAPVLAHVSLAEVAYQRDELDSARRHVSEGIPLCRQWVYALPLASGLVTLAWVRQAAGDPAGAMAAMSEAGQVAPGAGPAAPAPGIIEPLTARELQVLAMLAGGRSNQAIAAELVVALDTVKKHVSHVLGKLGAANRTEAVARARELGLIP